MPKPKKSEYCSGRKSCPFCGSTLTGVGWGHNPQTDKDECSVKCNVCRGRGPFCDTEQHAWEAWNYRVVTECNKLKNHVKLCKKNLKSDIVKCCATCPFEDMIIIEYPDLKPLFEAKRDKLANK
jgi:hypothetical protein